MKVNTEVSVRLGGGGRPSRSSSLHNWTERWRQNLLKTWLMTSGSLLSQDESPDHLRAA